MLSRIAARFTQRVAPSLTRSLRYHTASVSVVPPARILGVKNVMFKPTPAFTSSSNSSRVYQQDLMRFTRVHKRSFCTSAPRGQIVDKNYVKSLVEGKEKTPYVLIDVRTKEEVAQGMIPTAKNLPGTCALFFHVHMSDAKQPVFLFS